MSFSLMMLTVLVLATSSAFLMTFSAPTLFVSLSFTSNTDPNELVAAVVGVQTSRRLHVR